MSKYAKVCSYFKMSESGASEKAWEKVILFQNLFLLQNVRVRRAREGLEKHVFVLLHGDPPSPVQKKEKSLLMMIGRQKKPAAGSCRVLSFVVRISETKKNLRSYVSVCVIICGASNQTNACGPCLSLSLSLSLFLFYGNQPKPKKRLRSGGRGFTCKWQPGAPMYLLKSYVLQWKNDPITTRHVFLFF